MSTELTVDLSLRGTSVPALETPFQRSDSCCGRCGWWLKPKPHGVMIFLGQDPARYWQVVVPASWRGGGVSFPCVKRELWKLLEQKRLASLSYGHVRMLDRPRDRVVSGQLPDVVIERALKPLSWWAKITRWSKARRGRLQEPDGGPVGSHVTRTSELVSGNLYVLRTTAVVSDVSL